MRTVFIVLAALSAAACGTAQPRSVRYDMDQIAADTVMRDTAPGFGTLGEETPTPTRAVPTPAG